MSIIKTENLVRHFTVGTQTVEALRGVSLDINKGEFVAIMGPSGSGKSTLLNLIPRIYDPTEGKVLFDGQNIKNLNLKSIRKEISIVDQNTTLFDDTVFNNIKYAKPESSKEEIFKAAELSMSSEFINKFRPILAFGLIRFCSNILTDDLSKFKLFSFAYS